MSRPSTNRARCRLTALIENQRATTTPYCHLKGAKALKLTKWKVHEKYAFNSNCVPYHHNCLIVIIYYANKAAYIKVPVQYLSVCLSVYLSVCSITNQQSTVKRKKQWNRTDKAKGPVTLELRPPRLPHAQKNLLIAPNRSGSVVILGCKYAFSPFLLRPASFHHTPNHAQHRAGITLALRPLRL